MSTVTLNRFGVQSLIKAFKNTSGIIGSTDAALSTYGFQVQYNGSATGTVTFNGSFDGVNWTSLGTTTSSGITWVSNKQCPYLQAVLSGYSGNGTTDTVDAWIPADNLGQVVYNETVA